MYNEWVKTDHLRLKLLREGRGFSSQKHFCAHAQRYGFDIQPRRYGAIERGDARPTIDEIIDICEAMKISADAWLFGVDTRVDLRGLDSYDIAMLGKIADMLRDRK